MILSVVVLVSCKKEDNTRPGEIWKNSVFIVNEGPFQNGTGSVMAYIRTTGEVSGDLFESANGRPLGNIVQSIAVYGDLVWIAVNNSNKIEVANLEDFTSVATIENISLPRYMVFHKDKVYVSCWDNTVKVINTANFSVTGDLPAGTGPDEMAIAGDFLFVINSGGFGVDSTVTFFNLEDVEIFGNITVGHRPAGIVKDSGGKLWVLCSGTGWNGFPQAGDTPGRMVSIDPDSRTITTSIEFDNTDHHPDQLICNASGSILYYSYTNGIYAFPVMDPSIAISPLIPSDIMFYGLGFDPASGMIFASDPLDYAQNGRIYRFNSSGGAASDSFQAGIIPGGFWFNR